MIKLVTVEDIDKEKELPMEVVEQIKEVLEILEEEYGADRTESGLGGIVVVIESEQDLEVLKSDMFLDVWEEEPEWGKSIIATDNKEWKQFLFVMSSDYSIVVVGEEDKLSFIEGE